MVEWFSYIGVFMQKDSANNNCNGNREELISFYNTKFSKSFIKFKKEMEFLERNCLILAVVFTIAANILFFLVFYLILISSLTNSPFDENITFVEFLTKDIGSTLKSIFQISFLSFASSYVFVENFFCSQKRTKFFNGIFSIFSNYLGNIRLRKDKLKIDSAIPQKLFNMNESNFVQKFAASGHRNNTKFEIFGGDLSATSSPSVLTEVYNAVFVRVPIKKFNVVNFVMAKSTKQKPVFMPGQLSYDLKGRGNNEKYTIWTLSHGNVLDVFKPDIFFEIAKIADTRKNICIAEYDYLYFCIKTRGEFLSLKSSNKEMLQDLVVLQAAIYNIFNFLDVLENSKQDKVKLNSPIPQIVSNAQNSEKSQIVEVHAGQASILTNSNDITSTNNKSFKLNTEKTFTKIRTDFYKSIKEKIIPKVTSLENKRKLYATVQYLSLGILFINAFVHAVYCLKNPESAGFFSEFRDVPVFNVMMFFLYIFFPYNSLDYFPFFSIFLFAVVVIISIRIETEDSKLKPYIKNIVVPEIINAFGDLNWSSEYTISKDEALSLCLFPEFDIVQTDDYYSGVHKNVYFEVFNPRFVDKRTGSRGSTTYVDVFDGVIVKLKTNKPFKGHTVIVKDTPTHTSPAKHLRHTELEDVKFEQKYDVFTSDEIEARYLITTSFVTRLNRLKDTFLAKQICCVFKNEFIYFVFSKTDAFEVFSMTKPLTDFSQYTTLVEQLIAVHQLIDKLKLEQKIGM